jgi:hypothetical protein
MIDNNLKNQYNGIKAPADLKAQILADARGSQPQSNKKGFYK